MMDERLLGSASVRETEKRRGISVVDRVPVEFEQDLCVIGLTTHWLVIFYP